LILYGRLSYGFSYTRQLLGIMYIVRLFVERFYVGIRL